jgi:hypothetical protein
VIAEIRLQKYCYTDYSAAEIVEFAVCQSTVTLTGSGFVPFLSCCNDELRELGVTRKNKAVTGNASQDQLFELAVVHTGPFTAK